MDKTEWLYKYQSAVLSFFKKARKTPGWVLWPAGHMYHGMGLTPDVAARRYLAGTKWAYCMGPEPGEES